MNLSFWGTIVNAVGSTIIVFTPLGLGYGSPVSPAQVWLWSTGWILMIIGFIVQAIAVHRSKTG